MTDSRWPQLLAARAEIISAFAGHGVDRVEYVAALPDPEVWVWLGTATDMQRDALGRESGIADRVRRVVALEGVEGIQAAGVTVQSAETVERGYEGKLVLRTALTCRGGYSVCALNSLTMKDAAAVTVVVSRRLSSTSMVVGSLPLSWVFTWTSRPSCCNQYTLSSSAGQVPTSRSTRSLGMAARTASRISSSGPPVRSSALQILLPATEVLSHQKHASSGVESSERTPGHATNGVGPVRLRSAADALALTHAIQFTSVGAGRVGSSAEGTSGLQRHHVQEPSGLGPVGLWRRQSRCARSHDVGRRSGEHPEDRGLVRGSKVPVADVRTANHA